MQTLRDSKHLGTFVRLERKGQHLTQEQLAGLSGVGVRFIRELELGKESCQLGLALQVMTTLGLTLSVTPRREATP